MTDDSLKDRRSKVDEIHFLADNFDIAPIRAADLLAEGQEAEDLAAEAMREEHARDPLAEVPVPDPDKDPQHQEKDIADLGKPVVAQRSAAT